MKDNVHHIEPRVGEGIYLAKDVAMILRLDYAKTHRWIVGYWGKGLDKDVVYTFGEEGNWAINFLSLIEFYTFFKLREKGLSTTEIRKLHSQLSQVHHTKYPFAIAQDYYLEGRKRKKFVYYDFLSSLIRLDRKHQFSLKFVESFLDRVEFDDANLARRFFPLGNSRNVVVDPKHQFGQPVVEGTNIRTQTIFSLYKGGEKAKDISDLYEIPLEKVKDAIAFQKAA